MFSLMPFKKQFTLRSASRFKYAITKTISDGDRPDVSVRESVLNSFVLVFRWKESSAASKSKLAGPCADATSGPPEIISSALLATTRMVVQDGQALKEVNISELVNLDVTVFEY